MTPGLEPGVADSAAGGAGLAARHAGPSYEEKGRQLLKDPWAARDDYIEVILDRSPEKRGAVS